jgi:hypothetical protein
MLQKLGLFVAAVVALIGLPRQALALDTVQISFTGDAFDIGYHVWACGQVSYPADAQNLEMRLHGGTGDGDLYVCSGHLTPAGCYSAPKICTSTAVGNSENCSSAVAPGGNYTLCIYGYSAVNDITANVGHTTAGSSATTSAAASGSVTYWIDYFKDNLFLGIAYHRVGCMSSWNGTTGTVVSDLDYDFFSDGNYCRRGEHWKSGPESHGTSYMNESFGLGSNFTTAQNTLNSCGNATNSAYGTANYARRSTTCSYNILTNCNSDCGIKHFSNCVDGASGDGIDIASPCW